MRRLRSNDPCWCGSGAKSKRCHAARAQLARDPVATAAVTGPRAVPASITRPDYVLAGGAVSTPIGRQVHTADSLARHRHAGAVAAEVLLRAGAAVRAGITTDEIDAIAHDTYVELGAYPSTLGYRGPSGRGTPYPKSVCTSVNDVICHGIPNLRPLVEGDIVNVDVTAYVDGMHGDTSATFTVGTVSEAVAGLVESARLATLIGIAAIGPGDPLWRIGEAIETFASARGYGIVREYGGHGIGETFHGRPHINHTRERHDTERLVAGMTFTVEPMLTAGDPRFATADDGWSEQVLDRYPSAQFEHTVLVTDDGVEILTVTDGQSAVGGLDELGNPARALAVGVAANAR